MEFADEREKGGTGTLVLHLLGRCNLRCEHCYMEGAPTREEVLPLPLVLAAIRDCPELGIGAVYVTGGEPLLYSGFEEVVRVAGETPNLDVTVCTNGTRVRDRHVALLAQAKASANVSIDGLPEFHDRFRRLEGAFKSSERGVEQLVAARIPVTIVMSVSRANVDMLEPVARWAMDIGAVRLRVQPLLKLGRGLDIESERLGSVELNRLLLRLSDLTNRGKFECRLVGVTRKFLLAHPCGAYVCNGGGCHRRVAKEIKKVVVRENGTVLPEVTNLNPAFALGNLSDAPLPVLARRYLDNGYERFDQLCRETYAEVLPTWDQAVVPWDQIVAERSYGWRPRDVVQLSLGPRELGSCSESHACQRASAEG